MYVKPAVDRARFQENLAAAIQAKGHTSKSLADAAGIDEAVVHDARQAGIADDDLVAKLAKALDQDPGALAPLTNLRDPDRGDRLPPEGREVPETDWWKRRIAEGGVLAADPAQETKAPRKREKPADPAA